MAEGNDLRHLYNPQAEATRFRSTGLKDIVPTGVTMGARAIDMTAASEGVSLSDMAAPLEGGDKGPGSVSEPGPDPNADLSLETEAALGSIGRGAALGAAKGAIAGIPGGIPGVVAGGVVGAVIGSGWSSLAAFGKGLFGRGPNFSSTEEGEQALANAMAQPEMSMEPSAEESSMSMASEGEESGMSIGTAEGGAAGGK